MHNLIEHRCVSAVPVAGADLDYTLLSKLTVGDCVLVESNAERYYSDIDCPLVANFPWRVKYNNPPALIMQAKNKHKIVMENNGNELSLAYNDLLSYSPCIFTVRDKDKNTKFNWFSIQLISEYIDMSSVYSKFDKYDDSHLDILYRDFKEELFKEYQDLFRTFKHGYHNENLERLQLRLGSPTKTVQHIIDGDFDKIDENMFRVIHREVHWLKYLIKKDNLTVEEN